ncbi:MAG TPA: transporter substrate-binding domain-containing protein, partial [Candidatus Obscuribacterales bacterium]
MKFSITLSGGIALVAWALTGLVVPAPALAESLRVGIYQNEPKIFVDDAGQPAGFWVDILDHIAEAEDWSLTYVPCQWEACLRALEQGDLDLMMDVAYSEERDRLFDFNQEVVLPSWSVIYSRAGLTYDSILALDGQRVAVVKGSIQHATLREQTVSFGIAPVFVELDSFEDIFEQLEAGTVDAGVVNNFVGREAETEYTITKTNILVNPTRLHFVVAAGRSPTLLTDIDRHLRQLTSDGNSVYYRAKQQWLEPTRRQSLLSALRHAVLDGWVYIPVVGVAAFAVWN